MSFYCCRLFSYLLFSFPFLFLFFFVRSPSSHSIILSPIFPSLTNFPSAILIISINFAELKISIISSIKILTEKKPLLLLLLHAKIFHKMAPSPPQPRRFYLSRDATHHQVSSLCIFSPSPFFPLPGISRRPFQTQRTMTTNRKTLPLSNKRENFRTLSTNFPFYFFLFFSLYFFLQSQYTKNPFDNIILIHVFFPPFFHRFKIGLERNLLLIIL